MSPQDNPDQNPIFAADARFGPIELREYMLAALQEHKSLHDEILQRITARNYIVGLFAGFIITLHVQAFPALAGPDPVARNAWTWIALALIPASFMGLGTFLATNFAQINRLGLVVMLIEHKLNLVLRRAGGPRYEAALRELDGELPRLADGINLSAPMVWEGLLRSRKGGKMSRSWDRAFFRIWLPMVLAVVLSVLDALVAWHWGAADDRMLLSFCLGYLMVGCAVAASLSSPRTLGHWKPLRRWAQGGLEREPAPVEARESTPGDR